MYSFPSYIYIYIYVCVAETHKGTPAAAPSSVGHAISSNGHQTEGSALQAIHVATFHEYLKFCTKFVSFPFELHACFIFHLITLILLQKRHKNVKIK